MRNDVPAAIPLIGLIAGIAASPHLAQPEWSVAALLLASLLPMRPAVRLALLGAALGVFIAVQSEAGVARARDVLARLHPERFVVVEVPIEADWSNRRHGFVMRASQFRAADTAIPIPISIYARFVPREIAMESTVRAEVLLRMTERGEYAATAKAPQLLHYEGSLPRWHPAAWNRALANRLERHAARLPDEVALAQSLALGRGERLSDEQRESFRRGGTYHLLVFSGLQIAFAAGLLAALLRWLNAPRASDWLLLGFAAMAPLFIGGTASVSRASIGIGLYALSRIVRRPTSLENLWCVAAGLRLLIEPRDLTDPAFHLTYAGAGALLFIGKHLLVRTWLSHAVAAEVAIAPITLFHFNQYVFGGSLLTLLMSPLILAMLVVSAVACAFPTALRALTPLHYLCGRLNALGLSGYLVAPGVIALAASGLLALTAVALLRGRPRAVVVVFALLVPSLLSFRETSVRSSVRHPTVTFFDVGQGDAIAIRSGDSTVLIDGGPDRRLLQLLADRGIRRLDAVVLSHAHPDHCASLPAIVTELRVGRVFVSPRAFRGECATKLLESCSVSSTPVHLLRDETTIAAGAIALRVNLAGITFRRAPENNASALLRGTLGGRTFLFTGDIEKEGELYLNDRDLTADVLKVAHHGSRSSTDAALLDQVRPRLAVISCGRRNLFGHPHREVVEALEERRIRTLRTDRDGTVDVTVEEGRLYASSRRD